MKSRSDIDKNGDSFPKGEGEEESAKKCRK